MLVKDTIAFLKNWTLPTAICLGSIIYFLFSTLDCLTPVGIVMEPFFNEILPWLMFMVLYVTFCKIDFRQMRITRWHLWILGIQLLLVLFITLYIKYLATEQNEKILWESILACVVCPTAAASTVVTVKLGGSLSSMTTFAVISNMITALIIPVIFPLIETSRDISFVSAFLIILERVIFVLVAPLLFAWITKHYLPNLQGRIVRVKDLGFYLWGVALTIVTGTTVKNIVHADAEMYLLLLIAFSSLLLCLMLFLTGKITGYFFGVVIEGGQALGQKNTAFAIWITYMYLNPIASIGPGCYVLWQNIVNSWQLWNKRKKESAG
ncbi:MAG: transporter [Prevotella sp.]|nr:transporter [Prevotella sp.]